MTLYELNNLVRRSIETLLPGEYWVEAELSEVRESRGHCYLELIEKDERSATPIAKASAKCWRQTWMIVRPHFERVTGQTLRAGMKVMLKVYAQFHENYGFSWVVTDIDPTYTLGDMARKRLEIVKQLKEEGVFDLNKQLPLPLFTQRIAVISSETAAGYGDFCAQLRDNDYGFRFSVELFSAIMQGEQVERSIIEALNTINDRGEEFDCVVIIRGGGATSDMSGFDTLALAENVANFPLPVITGIGHDRDESVLDMVAHTNVKTPTAAAALLISNLKTVADTLDDRSSRLARTLTSRMERERLRLANAATRLPSLYATVKTRHDSRLALLSNRLIAALRQRAADCGHQIDNLASRLAPAASAHMERQRHSIELLAQRAAALDPQLLLRRGYSVTLLDGHAIHDTSNLKPGIEITTRVEHGTFTSTIK